MHRRVLHGLVEGIAQRLHPLRGSSRRCGDRPFEIEPAENQREDLSILVGLGVSLTLKDGVCTAARVGLGAVAPTVLLVEAAARALIGSKLDDAALKAAAAACSAACRPIDDKRGTIVYRTKVAGVLLKRTALIAAKRATGK